MTRSYEFGDRYTPEQAYAVPRMERGQYWNEQGGGSKARGDDERSPAVFLDVALQGEPAGLRTGQIMGNMREAEAGVAEPIREGFKASGDGAASMSEAGADLAAVQGETLNTASKGLGQAMMDRSRGRADQFRYMGQELMSIQAANEQRADSRRRGGGVIGAVSSIVGGIVGGPVGAGIGALGGLFG